MTILIESLTTIKERIIKKWVIRKGKKIRKKVSTRKGYKVVDGREVKMTPQERRKRKLAQRKAVRKRKPKMSRIIRKRERSLRKRKATIH